VIDIRTRDEIEELGKNFNYILTFASCLKSIGFIDK